MGETRAIDGLLQVVEAHREEAEVQRHLPLPVREAIQHSQLSLMTVGAESGGLGMSLPKMVQTLDTIAAADAAAAWVIWNGSLVGLYARYMPEPLRREVFGRPDVLLCQSTIPAGTLARRGDEALVAGQWPLVSGCTGAHWAILTVVEDAGAASKTSLVALPESAFSVVDTWDSSGLRGTGSHDLRVDEQSVPSGRTFALEGTPEGAPEGAPEGECASERLPIFATVSALFGAQVLGLGRAVLRFCTDEAPASRRENSAYQVAIARHGAAMDAARNELFTTADRVWQQAVSEHVSQDLTADLYAANFLAIDAVRAAVTEFHAMAGTSGLYKSSPLEKRWRDLDAMLRHIVAQPVMQADVGRCRLGMAPDWPLFFV